MAILPGGRGPGSPFSAPSSRPAGRRTAWPTACRWPSSRSRSCGRSRKSCRWPRRSCGASGSSWRKSGRTRLRTAHGRAGSSSAGGWLLALCRGRSAGSGALAVPGGLGALTVRGASYCLRESSPHPLLQGLLARPTGNWGSGRWSCFPEIRELVGGRVWMITANITGVTLLFGGQGVSDSVTPWTCGNMEAW